MTLQVEPVINLSFINLAIEISKLLLILSHTGIVLLIHNYYADTEGIANTAAGAVKITYSDVKPPILTIQDAIQKKSFFPQPTKDLLVGDAESKFYYLHFLHL